MNSSNIDLLTSLQTCESRLDGILQHSPSVIFIKDLAGHYRMINRQFETTFGLPQQEIIGKTDYDFFQKDIADGFHKDDLRVIEEEKVVVSDEIIPVGNQTKTYLTVKYPTRDHTGAIDGICGIATDITTRKHIEESLQIIFDSAADGIILVDSTSYNFINVNAAMCRMLGYSLDELKKLSVQDIHPAESLDRVNSLIKKQISGDLKLATDIPMKRKDGSIFFADISASVTTVYGRPHLLGIARDITERKQAEAERKLLMSANEQMSEIIVITDSDGVIQYVNQAFSNVTGYSSEEVIGQTPQVLKSGKQDAEFYKEMWNTLTQGVVWHGRFVNKRKDGSLYTEDATISPIIDEAGAITNYVAVKRDISNQIELEQQLRQAQKMEAVGQLAGGIAHDFNNLLHIIQGYSDLLVMDTSTGSPNCQKLEGIQDAAKKAATLVRQLLTFSRRQVIQPKDHDLNLIITDILKMLRRLIGENIELDFVAGEKLETICVDRSQMEQMLINLCVNARDAMPSGGKLIVETKSIVIDEIYAKTHAWAQPGNFIMLSVCDTGCGMNSELTEHIFDPFFTTKEVGKGTGLGLSTVFGIVKQNNGLINVCSKINSGTTFTIYIPIVERPPVQETMFSSVTANGGNETILIAEDDEGIIKLATMILSDAGYTVLTANNGHDLVKVFEENSSEIDLILTDVVMPGISGEDAVKHILKKYPNIPYIFASGYSENDIHSNYIKHEKINLLQKPYGLAALLKAIRDALDG